MMVAILPVGILAALFVLAAVFDLLSFTIPNVLTASMMALFGVFLITMAASGHALSWDQTGSHILAGFVGLIAGMGMFAAGWVGGGDAKLFAVASLWLGLDAMFEYTVFASLLGGALTFALLALRQFPFPRLMARPRWLARLADPRADIPYGVALSLAALWVLPGTELFHLAI